MSWPMCLLTLKAKVQDCCFLFELCVAGPALYPPLASCTCMHVVVVQHAEHSIMPRERDLYYNMYMYIAKIQIRTVPCLCL